MKKILVVLTITLLVSVSAFAQVVVQPAVMGTVNTYVVVSSPSTVAVDAITGASTGYWFGAGRAYYWFPYYYGEWQGVLEFNVDGLPTASMTTSNWTARLNSIGVSSTYPYSSTTMFVDLFDLDDSGEDGVVSAASDFDNYLGTMIARRTQEPGYGGIVPGSIDAVVDDPNDGVANFTNIDVTEQLRRDLFGAGTGDATTGFIFMASPYDANQLVFYNAESPNLTITVETTNTGAEGSSNDCFIDTIK